MYYIFITTRYSFMKINSDQVVVYLKQLQEKHGGYYGNDIYFTTSQTAFFQIYETVM